VGELRPAPKPLITSQPEGPTFTIQDGEIVWQNWHFRFGMHPRIGLVLYTVGYEDGGELRPILYRASLGEIVVPYADPSPDWFFRNAFDAGEYGLGRSTVSLRPGQECPAYATYFDTTFADGFGAAYQQANVACLFEVDAGDILWKHYDWVNELDEMRHDRKLVLRFIATTGNYDYGFDWIFHQDGSLEQRTQAMGIVLSKGVTSTTILSPTAELETRYGPLVGQNIVATYHQHFLNWRLDLDVDGQMNSAMEMNVQAFPPNSTTNPWLNAFGVQETMFETELEAQRDANMATQRMWGVINMDRQNALGYPTGYMLLPGSNSLPYAHPQARIRRRAAFMNHHLWVTPYQPNELYSAGNYPHLNPTDTGLGLWTQADRPIDHRDIVLWYTMGLTHVPHSEEWPIMSTHMSGFKLVPMNFFDRNPAVNLPADEE
jgi:primary-amine oxidase